MNTQNLCLFEGNFVADPEIVKVNESNVVNFVLAVNDYYKNKNGEVVDQPSFIKCEAWDSGAEAIYDMFRKGDRIFIESNLRTSHYENKQGEKRSASKYRVRRFIPVRIKSNEQTQ